MGSPAHPVPEGPSILEEISTHWPLVSNPLQFVLRYAPAMRRYLSALIKNSADADDVAQTFLLHTVSRPFTREQVRHGRFRDYLKAALRYQAVTHLRKGERKLGDVADLGHLAAPDAEAAADREWLLQWRECLLARAWEGLEQHEREAPDGLAYTVLRLAADYPDEDSAALAARAEKLSGRRLRPDAFRKQLSRARRRFAQLIVNEVKETVGRPGAAEVVEELREVGLMEYVRDYLPERFRDMG